jgi:hypothetical protein
MGYADALTAGTASARDETVLNGAPELLPDDRSWAVEGLRP